MATQQRVLSGLGRAKVRLVCLKQNADVEMLDGGALEEFKMPSPSVCAATEPCIHAVDDMAICEFPLKKGNALFNESEILWITRESRSGVVPMTQVSITP